MEEMKIMTLWSMLLLSLWDVTAINGQIRSCFNQGDAQIYQTDSFGGVDNAGRVEICMGGVWGTIAADSIATPWSEKNAQVACIQAGFSGVLNVILQETISFAERSESLSVPIHLSGVQCDGSERGILNCSNSSTIPSTVNHLQDAYIVCRPQSHTYSDVHPAGEQSGDIRLFGDPRNGYGAVEIYSSRRGWQGICPDSSWTNSDAATICQDLGYASGTIISPVIVSSSSSTRAPFGQLYAASCPPRAGDPAVLGVCSFQTIPSTSDCISNQFAALRCNNASEMSVRLLGGDDSREGIVEIAYNGRWGMLCDDGFTDTDAQSVCQGLGFGRDNAVMMSSSSLSQILESESNLKPIWLTELACSSSDSSLVSCISEENILGFAECQRFDIVAVDCGNPSSSSIRASEILSIVIVMIFSPLLVIAFIVIFGCFFVKPCWKKRHTYSWYNTLTTPSDWCDCGCCDCDYDCDCDCFSLCTTTTTRQATAWQSNASSFTGITVTGSCSDPTLDTTVTLNLTRRISLDRQPEHEPEPEPVSEPSDPGLSKAPPPSYKAASNFPTHDLKADLPPPYPGGPCPTAPPPPPPTATAYPPATAPGYPQTAATASDAAYPPPTAPGYPQTATAPDAGAGYPPSWTSPAYPPLSAAAQSGSSELPYPSDNPPYPL